MISISNDNDFLWECAFVKQSDLGNDCNWIVPNKDDLNPFYDSHDYDNNVDDKQHVIRLYSNNTKQSNMTLKSCIVTNGIRLNIQEIRDFGVVDIIGGEIWEASYLLCGYILSHQGNYLLNSSTFELGAGLSVPSLLISKLKQLQMSQISNKDHIGQLTNVYISDYEPKVLHHLNSTIDKLFCNSINSNNDNTSSSNTDSNQSSETICDDALNEADPYFRIHTLKLDWNDFDSDHYTQNISKINDKLSSYNFDYFIGAALCYAPCHISLADTILHFFRLPNCTCKEAVIIQLKTRPGFSLFINRLVRLNIRHSLQDIDENVVNISNQIQITRYKNDVEIHFPKNILPFTSNTVDIDMNCCDGGSSFTTINSSHCDSNESFNNQNSSKNKFSCQVPTRKNIDSSDFVLLKIFNDFKK